MTCQGSLTLRTIRGSRVPQTNLLALATSLRQVEGVRQGAKEAKQ